MENYVQSAPPDPEVFVCYCFCLLLFWSGFSEDNNLSILTDQFHFSIILFAGIYGSSELSWKQMIGRSDILQ